MKEMPAGKAVCYENKKPHIDTRGESNSIPCRMYCVCLLRAKFFFSLLSVSLFRRDIFIDWIVYSFVGPGSLRLTSKQQQGS